MFVTAKLLDKLKACKEERNRFAELFPFGVELSRTVIVQHAQEFNWTWCAENLASEAGLTVYDRAERLARTVYDQDTNLAYFTYVTTHTATIAELAQAQSTYRQAVEPALAAYNLARAAAFADAIGL